MSHRIHLKGPWGCERLEGRAAAGAPREKVRLPATWQQCLGSYRGTVCFTRTFHPPTNLDSHERVFLMLTGVSGQTKLLLNGRSLGETVDAPCEFDITHQLEPNNHLRVQIEFREAGDQRPGGLWGPVVLEIRAHPESS